MARLSGAERALLKSVVVGAGLKSGGMLVPWRFWGGWGRGQDRGSERANDFRVAWDGDKPGAAASAPFQGPLYHACSCERSLRRRSVRGDARREMLRRWPETIEA
jgi:hypothetical protein